MRIGTHGRDSGIIRSEIGMPGYMIFTMEAGTGHTAASNKPSEIEIGEHLIGAFIGDPKGPTLIAVGSIHGNEPGGATALMRISEKLPELAAQMKGRVYLLAGNTRALQRNVRFIDADLNRHWTAPNLTGATGKSSAEVSEDTELDELDTIFDHILITAEDEVYVLDLHSTSADGMPFATVGDTLRNRNFARKFPITMLLGIEEQLDGTLLEYLNHTGAVTLGFEGGQHTSPQTIDNHEALVWLAIANAGILDASLIPDLDKHRNRLSAGQNGSLIYEVRYRHAIRPEDEFTMNPGFNNFDPIHHRQVLGNDRNGPVRATESGLLLMPLYQKLGEDGFFIGRRVAGFWLWLSGILRRFGVPRYVHLLPGVTRDKNDEETLIVDTTVARLFPLQIFHLLGFRRRRWNGNKLVVSRRKHDNVSPFRGTD